MADDVGDLRPRQAFFSRIEAASPSISRACCSSVLVGTRQRYPDRRPSGAGRLSAPLHRQFLRARVGPFWPMKVIPAFCGPPQRSALFSSRPRLPPFRLRTNFETGGVGDRLEPGPHPRAFLAHLDRVDEADQDHVDLPVQVGDDVGELAFPPLERKRTGPSSGWSSSGLQARATPSTDPAGQAEAANWTRVQGLLTWDWSMNSERGRSTCVRARFDCPSGAFQFGPQRRVAGPAGLAGGAGPASG